MLRADPGVVRQLHLDILRIVAETEAVYGDVGLRLEGGTALAAYHLGHRESEDLDFFGDPHMDARDFGAALQRRLEADVLPDRRRRDSPVSSYVPRPRTRAAPSAWISRGAPRSGWTRRI